MSHDSFVCVTRLIRRFDVTHSHVCTSSTGKAIAGGEGWVRSRSYSHDSLRVSYFYVRTEFYMCRMTRACICASSTGKAIAGREGGQRGHGPTHMTHSRLWHLYEWHNFIVCVTWLMHVYSHHQRAKELLVGKAGSKVTVLLTWLIRVYDTCVCGMTYLNMPHDSCIYMYIINRQSSCWWGRRGARSRSNLSGTKCSIMSRFYVIISKLHSEWASWAST